MTLRLIGYSCIITATGEEIASSKRLPFSPSPPGKPRGRIATFTEVGQEAGAYKVVERYTVIAPTGSHLRGEEDLVSFDGTKTIVDPDWVFQGLAVSVARAKDGIKGKANTHITASYSQWRQRNLSSDFLTLLKARVINGTWTSKENSDIVEVEADLAKIKAVRAHSDVLEAEVDAIADGAGTDEEKAVAISAWQPHNWPVMK